MAQFSELYGTRLDRELGSIDSALFTTARRKAALNEAMLEFVRLTGCTQSTESINLIDGTAEYDIDTGLLNPFLWLAKDGVLVSKLSGGVTTYYTGNDLVRRDVVWLDRFQPGWRSASKGTPTAYYLRDSKGVLFLGFSPAPKITNDYTMSTQVTYIGKPVDMAADADLPFTMKTTAITTDAPSYLEPYHQALAHFAAARLESLRKNYQAYDRQMQLFNSYIADYMQKQRRPGGMHVTLGRDYYGEASTKRISGISPDWWLR